MGNGPERLASMPVAIANQDEARRLGDLPMARPPQGVVSDSEVPTGAGEEGGTPSGGLIQFLPDRMSADVEAAVIVAVGQEPAVTRDRRGRHRHGADRLLQAGETRDAPQVGVNETETETVGDGVGVVVVEPRKQRPPLQIDDAGPWPHVIPQLVAGADAGNAVPDDRRRFGGQPGVIDGDSVPFRKTRSAGIARQSFADENGSTDSKRSVVEFGGRVSRGLKPGIDKNAVGTDRSARVAVAKV
jgi:hypothetical protein